MKFYEEIYLGRNNQIQRSFTINGLPLDLTTLTRVTFEISLLDECSPLYPILNNYSIDYNMSSIAPGEIYPLDKDIIVDSNTYPSAFDWRTLGSSGILIMSLGSVTGAEYEYSSGEMPGSGYEESPSVTLPVGNFRGKFVIYGPDFPNGLDGWGYIWLKIIPKTEG